MSDAPTFRENKAFTQRVINALEAGEVARASPFMLALVQYLGSLGRLAIGIHGDEPFWIIRHPDESWHIAICLLPDPEICVR